MKISENNIRALVRRILLEEYPPEDSGAPDVQGKEGTLIDWEQDEIDQKIPIGTCKEPSVGDPVVFHGLGMHPCGGKGSMAGGIVGPYLGGVGNERKLYPHEIEDAISYLEKYKPSEIFAYSRGGAMALQVLMNGGPVPSKQTWMAPAWGRGFGPMPTDASNASGSVYIGGRDNKVSLMSMILACQSNPSLKLYVHPYISHTSMIYARLKNFKGFEEIGKDVISQTKEGSLPTWAPSGAGSAEDVNAQIKWIIKNTSSNWKLKPGFEIPHEEGMKERKLIEAISIIVRGILQEKKKVKCPLKNGKRDYKCEYRKYGGASKKGKSDRNKRNQARRRAKKDGRVSKGDGKEIDHIKPLSKGGSNSKSNQRVVSRSTNRKKGNK